MNTFCSMKWVELKMQQLGVLSNPNYKITALLDHMAMITVQSDSRGIFDCKPLGLIWAHFPEVQILITHIYIALYIIHWLLKLVKLYFYAIWIIMLDLCKRVIWWMTRVSFHDVAAVLHFKKYHNVWWSTEKLCNESTKRIDHKTV